MRRPRSGDIASSLRARIAGGEWDEKRLLPNERALSAEYGVARNTVRRAMLSLVEDGLLARHVGRGTEIIGQRAAPVADDGHDLVRIVARLAGTSPLDIMNMRLIIEPEAASSAAANASATELAAITEAHETASATTEMFAFEHWDTVFHQRIFMATRNDLLRNLNDVLTIIRSQPRIAGIRRRGFTEERRRSTCEQHAAVVSALIARDPEGSAEAMRQHLAAHSRHLFGASIL
jgi:DNA-binding FadR family transcriptional regulator